MITTHILKTDPDVFKAAWDGIKRYEIRFDDRHFEIGDKLKLVETVHAGEEMKNGAPLEYTGRYISQKITHKLKGIYGLKDDWCILSTVTIVRKGQVI